MTSGSAAISQAGSLTVINQSSQKAAINWQGFSIAAGETVNFQQPGAGAVTLNRVIGNERSVIDGALNANGQVFLINSAGVLFGKGSQVKVGGLVASTRDISDADFEAGHYVFSGTGSGSVVNQGSIETADGGYVALLGQQAINEGVIVATRGTVALAAGNKVSLEFDDGALLGVTIEQGALDALVENKQAIYADGGKVFLTARAADELLGSQVNTSGIVQARTLGDLKGEIVAYAYGGTAHIDGTLDASAPDGGDGGFIETSGDAVKVADSAVITTKAASGKTGSWLIDPDGFTIANSGGDMSATLLASLLASDAAEITIESTMGSGSNGDLDVNDAVSWSSNAKLTLKATDDVNVNAAITAGGDSAGLTLTAGGDINVNADITLSGDHAALAMHYGGDYNIDMTNGAAVTLDGANAEFSTNGTLHTLIHDMAALAAISGVNGTYALAKDLDAAGTTYTSAVVANLLGTLAGLGHTVSNLTINASTGDRVGLIGTAGNTASGIASTVRDIGVVNANVTGKNYVGALVAYLDDYGTVSNAYATGTVSGYSKVGGLVGYAYRETIIDSTHAGVAVTGTGGDYIGGLVGQAGTTVISNSYATGDVNSSGGTYGGRYIGGLAGLANVVSSSHATGKVTVVSKSNSTLNYVGGLIGATGATGNVTNSYAIGEVLVTNGGQRIGGLIGWNKGSIDASYATGNVSGYSHLGGLVGYNDGGSITNSYAAIGDVSGSGNIGGLVGYNSATGVISNVYARGNVNSTGSSVGGLVGTNYGSISNAEASGNVNGSINVGGLVGNNYGASASITNSVATGNVTGRQNVGGFAGKNDYGALISDSQASGDVIAFDNSTTQVGTSNVGGLVGINGENGSATINNSSATGSVLGEQGTNVGGLVGQNNGTVTGNSWYRDVAAEAAEQAAAERAAAEAAAQAAAEAAARAAAEAAAQAAAEAAARAAAEAAAQAAAEAAAQAAAEAAAQAAAEAAAQAAAEAQALATLQARADTGTRSAAGTVADMQRTSPPAPDTGTPHTSSPSVALDDHIAFTDTRQFSAGIQSIEVGGVVYQLDGGGEDDKRPEQRPEQPAQ